ncbi:MAG: polyketide synthase, partial [Myxococcaceae bacterium]
MEPIAVVGIGCVVPGALSVDAFWRNLIDRHVSLAQVPRSAWDHALYFDPDRRAPDRTYCQLGGFVQDFVFDWKRFKVPPADAQAVNAMQWMILEAGTQALTPLAATLPKERTSIILGATGLGWQKDSGLRIRLDEMLDAIRSSEGFASLPAARRDAVLQLASERLLARLKDVSEDNVVGASASVAAGRINMHFDLRGPHYSVDAGFASSLSALDLAVRGLRDGEFDVALTGGASELLSPLELIAFSKLGALASELPRPFDARTDGTVLGEGVALFALKRMGDAVAAGDVIHALIRGVGGSSDGSGKSLVAPRAETQALAMRRAIADAGDDVSDLQYVECHATGTPLGDATELHALNSVYGGAQERQRRIALGAVKANVGHLRAA